MKQLRTWKYSKFFLIGLASYALLVAITFGYMLFQKHRLDVRYQTITQNMKTFTENRVFADGEVKSDEIDLTLSYDDLSLFHETPALKRLQERKAARHETLQVTKHQLLKDLDY